MSKQENGYALDDTHQPKYDTSNTQADGWENYVEQEPTGSDDR